MPLLLLLTMPPQISGIARNTTLNIQVVTLSANLSVSDHIREVLGKCSQTLYALRVLRSHGLCDAGLQTVFQSIIAAKLLYASSAWREYSQHYQLRQRAHNRPQRTGRCTETRIDSTTSLYVCIYT